MNLEINGAIAPAGVVGSAKNYTIILEEQMVYLLYMGPAATNVQSYNPLETMLNDYLGKRVAKKIAIGTARLAEVGKEVFAKEKHSAVLTAADVQRTALRRSGNSLILTIKSNQGNYKLILKRDVYTEVEKIVEILTQ